MGSPTVPPVIPQPFANNNAALRNTIPNTTSSPGAASWDQGFPSDTMQPVVAGGVPPFGQDMNGVEFALSSHDYYVQAGCLFPFQSAVATAIGGYGVGALLGSVSDPDVVWFNTVANNSTDPDSGGTTGWVSLFAYGFDTHNGLTGTSVLTLTNLSAARKFIVLNGVLIQNLVVNLPASLLKDWLIINNTSGSFTTTVKTAAGGSVGVTVPQGGWSNPLGVYSDGTNVYPTVAPLGVPISQGPDPLTLAERTNAGYILATYLNQNSPSGENPTVGSVFVENSGADGFLRKASLAYFESVLTLSAIGGAVTAGQVPLAPVIQYAPNILANAALTGVPTTPTAAVGTANAQVASAGFVNPGSSISGGGPWYRRNPDGSIDQWGTLTYTTHSGAHAINFNLAFPAVCQSVVISTEAATIGWDTWIVNGSKTVNGFQITDDASGANTVTINWQAKGR